MFLCDEVLAQRDGDGESPAARPELLSKPPFSIDEMLCSFISTYTCRLFYFTQNAGSKSYESTLQSNPIMVHMCDTSQGVGKIIPLCLYVSTSRRHPIVWSFPYIAG